MEYGDLEHQSNDEEAETCAYEFGNEEENCTSFVRRMTYALLDIAVYRGEVEAVIER